MFGSNSFDLQYKLKSMEMKINNINRDLHVDGKTASGGLHFKQAIQELDKRATQSCNDLVEKRNNLREGNLVFELANKKFIIIMVL